MSLIDYIKQIIISIRRFVLWHLQYLLAKYRDLVPEKLSVLNISVTDSILIIAPHADDEWIGAFSLLNLRRNNIKCCYLNFYGNDYSEKNIKQRTQEIMDSSRFWGFELTIVEKCDIEIIKNSIKKTNKCFIPSPYDWHTEHRKAFCLFFSAYNQLTNEEKKEVNVFYYSISVPHSNIENLVCIPLTKKDLSFKWREFKKVYRSQSFMPAVRYKLQLRLIPNRFGYAAQTFIDATEERMKEDYMLVNKPDVIQKLNLSSNDIYNICDSRNIVNRIIYRG